MTDLKDGSGGQNELRGGKRAWPLLVGVLLITLAAAAAVFALGGGGERNSAPSGREDAPRRAEQGQAGGGEGRRASEGGPELGHPSQGRENAPVKMIEYSDYQ